MPVLLVENLATINRTLFLSYCVDILELLVDKICSQNCILFTIFAFDVQNRTI